MIELVWTLSGLGAVVVALATLPENIRDYRAAKTSNRVVQILAREYVRREVLRLVQGSLIASIGIYACWVPPPVPGPAQINVVGLILTGALIGVSLIVVVQSTLDRVASRQVRRLLNE